MTAKRTRPRTDVDDDGMAVVTHRVPKRLVEDMNQAAEQAGMTRSQWLREITELAIQWDWMAKNRKVLVHDAPTRQAPAGTRRLGMNVYMPAGTCLHPPTAREVQPGAVVCGLCGQKIRRLM